jgi:hypothetical protein
MTPADTDWRNWPEPIKELSRPGVSLSLSGVFVIGSPDEDRKSTLGVSCPEGIPLEIRLIRSSISGELSTSL